MSVRWMAVQYLGDVLRLPVANASDMDKPVGHSTLERVVNRIEVNAFSENPADRKTFVPEDENEKLRELVHDMCNLLPHADWPSIECDEKASACIEQAIELGIEVSE